MTQTERLELLADIDRMRHELDQLAFPPARPVGDPSDIAISRAARRRSLEWWIDRAETLLELGEDVA